MQHSDRSLPQTPVCFLSDCPLQVCHYKMDIHPEMSIDESFKKRYTVCRNLIIGMKGAWKVSCGKKSITF